jgi:2-polyprenyl-3-methyl-5-hydroxy-6-metoxy-1,4-benzoquinol methylase
MTDPMATAARPQAASGDEQARVEALAHGFSSERGFNARLIDYRFRAIAPFLAGAMSALELGCADGRMTGQLAALVPQVTAVDGAPAYVDLVRRRHPGVDAVASLFEEYAPGRSFDAVVLAHVLEHVDDPVAILARARTFLAPGGRAIVTVPNADSLHRHVGVAMGLLGAVTDLNDADRSIGHRRVYTREALVADVRRAGLEPVHVGGVYLKPLSNAQIERDWSTELQDAFHVVGERFPELCAELLVVARNRGGP